MGVFVFVWEVMAGAKAHDQFRTLSRNAEALLPSAKAEGSHPAQYAAEGSHYKSPGRA
jgi:hypothetical protein